MIERLLKFHPVKSMSVAIGRQVRIMSDIRLHSATRLVGGVVTSHLVDLELIHTILLHCRGLHASRPHALTLQRLALQKSAVTAICSALFAEQSSAESKHVVGWCVSFCSVNEL